MKPTEDGIALFSSAHPPKMAKFLNGKLSKKDRKKIKENGFMKGFLEVMKDHL